MVSRRCDSIDSYCVSQQTCVCWFEFRPRRAHLISGPGFETPLCHKRVYSTATKAGYVNLRIQYHTYTICIWVSPWQEVCVSHQVIALTVKPALATLLLRSIITLYGITPSCYHRWLLCFSANVCLQVQNPPLMRIRNVGAWVRIPPVSCYSSTQQPPRLGT